MDHHIVQCTSPPCTLMHLLVIRSTHTCSYTHFCLSGTMVTINTKPSIISGPVSVYRASTVFSLALGVVSVNSKSRDAIKGNATVMCCLSGRIEKLRIACIDDIYGVKESPRIFRFSYFCLLACILKCTTLLFRQYILFSTKEIGLN